MLCKKLELIGVSLLILASLWMVIFQSHVASGVIAIRPDGHAVIVEGAR